MTHSPCHRIHDFAPGAVSKTQTVRGADARWRTLSHGSGAVPIVRRVPGLHRTRV